MLDTFGIKKGVEIACFTNLLMFKKLLGHFNNLIFIISIIVATLGFFFGISPNHLVCLIHRKSIILSQGENMHLAIFVLYCFLHFDFRESCSLRDIEFVEEC